MHVATEFLTRATSVSDIVVRVVVVERCDIVVWVENAQWRICGTFDVLISMPQTKERTRRAGILLADKRYVELFDWGVGGFVFVSLLFVADRRVITAKKTHRPFSTTVPLTHHSSTTMFYCKSFNTHNMFYPASSVVCRFYCD